MSLTFGRIAQILCIGILVAGKAFPQFFGLAATDDGAQVYFATGLRLKAEHDLRLPDTVAIYRVVGAGAVGRLASPPLFNPIAPVSHGNAQVSGGGTVVAYTETTTCVGGSSCLSRPTTRYSHLFVNGIPSGNMLGGAAQVSRNGRYVWNAGSWSFFGFPETAFDELHDLSTGEVVQPPLRPAHFRQSITREGGVLGFRDSATPVLWSPRAERVIETAETPSFALIDDAGMHVIYGSSTQGSVRLHAIETATGAESLLADVPGAIELQPSITNLGTFVMYVASPRPDQPPQVWLVRPDGSGRRQLTDFAEGVDEAVITGFGNAVLAVTGGRLVSIDVETGSVEELIGRSPSCGAGFASLIPGSILPIFGQWLTTETQTAPVPLPDELSGVRVLANGEPLPVHSIAPGAIWFQVPFEMQLTPSMTVELPDSGLFAGWRPDPDSGSLTAALFLLG